MASSKVKRRPVAEYGVPLVDDDEGRRTAIGTKPSWAVPFAKPTEASDNAHALSRLHAQPSMLTRHAGRGEEWKSVRFCATISRDETAGRASVEKQALSLALGVLRLELNRGAYDDAHVSHSPREEQRYSFKYKTGADDSGNEPDAISLTLRVHDKGDHEVGKVSGVQRDRELTVQHLRGAVRDRFYYNTDGRGTYGESSDPGDNFEQFTVGGLLFPEDIYQQNPTSPYLHPAATGPRSPQFVPYPERPARIQLEEGSR